MYNCGQCGGQCDDCKRAERAAGSRRSYTPSATISLTDKSADTLKRERYNSRADALRAWGVGFIAWGLVAATASIWLGFAGIPFVALAIGALMIIVGSSMREVEAIERPLPKDD